MDVRESCRSSPNAAEAGLGWESEAADRKAAKEITSDRSEMVTQNTAGGPTSGDTASASHSDTCCRTHHVGSDWRQALGLDHLRYGVHGVNHGLQEDNGWSDWVSASSTRSWCLRNPLQDWLELHGENAGFERDPEPDPRTDFREFIFAKGSEFEAAVVRLLARQTDVSVIEGFANPSRSLEARDATFAAMARGAPVIAQGVLWDDEHRTYGAADLLVRSDILRQLFPDALNEDEALSGARALGLSSCHYRVIDIKFTTLRLDRRWTASREHLPYLAQVFVYNRALGRTQGYLPPTSFLLGRSWIGPRGSEGASCLDRLAPVPNALEWKDTTLEDVVMEATAWVRRARSEGAGWHPIDGPTVPELRPNPSAADYPWQNATKLIAEQMADPILAWQVGCEARETAADAGLTRWTDPDFSSDAAGVSGTRGLRLDIILEHNRRTYGPVVIPARIQSERDAWIHPARVEFFVDFETVSNLDDDFSRLPQRGGRPMIFMVGCGHLEDGEWKFECFIAESLELGSEAAIIERWLDYMETVRLRRAPELQEPLVIHWSPAESSGLTNGLKSARNRHPERSRHWPEPNWFDFLGRVVRAEPVVVRGPMGFGLKTFARSLKRHGLIETEWEDSITDGLGAMVGAWQAYREAAETCLPVAEHELMHSIRRYNEVDCRVMVEVVGYLRQRH
jgi:hypothetical protein